MQNTIKKYFSDCDIVKCEDKYKYDFVCTLLYFLKEGMLRKSAFLPPYNSYNRQNNIEEYPLSWYDVYNFFEKPFILSKKNSYKF